MKRLTLISNLFYPDQLGGAALYTDMANYFREHGWNVRVVTTFPYYPAWEYSEEDKLFNRREDQIEGNQVCRLKMYIPEKLSGFLRILSDLSFFFALMRDEVFHPKKANVFLTASPLLSQCLFSWVMNLKKRASVVIIVQDFPVGAASNVGLWRAGLSLRILEIVEKGSFRSGNVLSSISEGMVSRLKEIVGSNFKSNVVHLPNWIHSSLETHIQKLNEQQSTVRREKQLYYSGNIGAKQALHDFIEVFRDSEFASWTLTVRGSGAGIEKVEASSGGCERIELGSIQNELNYLTELRSCTAYLITQKSGSGDDFFPSKLLPALASGSPILAVCDPGSTLENFVEKHEIGECIRNEKRDLEKLLLRWEREPELLSSYSENALSIAQKYRRETVLGNYLQIVQSLVEDERNNVY